MSKNVLILSGSFRKEGNSNLLATSFMEGAAEAGHQVKTIETAKLNINGCRVCNKCYSDSDACSFDKDFSGIAPLIEEADVIVLATPIYWFNLPMQLKGVMDKLYALLIGKRNVKNKEAVLITCGEMDTDDMFDSITSSYLSTVNYLNWKNIGELYVKEVCHVGDVQNTDMLEKAYELGKGI